MYVCTELYDIKELNMSWFNDCALNALLFLLCQAVTSPATTKKKLSHCWFSSLSLHKHQHASNANNHVQVYTSSSGLKHQDTVSKEKKIQKSEHTAKQLRNKRVQCIFFLKFYSTSLNHTKCMAMSFRTTGHSLQRHFKSNRSRDQ